MAKRWMRAGITIAGWISTAWCGFILLVLGIRWAGFDWNTTESAPVGIYRLTDAPLTHGQLVYFCLPTSVAQFGYERGYIHKVPWWSFLRECPSGYQPLLKPVVAVAGDVVTLSADKVWVGNASFTNSATQAHDSKGRELPHAPWGEYQLARGEYFVLSTVWKNSWDSRYYGVVRTEQVLGTATPWLVWPTTVEAGQ